MTKFRHSLNAKNDISSNLAGPFDGSENSKRGIHSSSTKNKISWVFCHEARFTRNVETFEILIEKLYALIPPDLDTRIEISNFIKRLIQSNTSEPVTFL